MDKALETTYTMRGVTRVVRTDATGSEARTARQHMKACRAAVDELHKLTRADWIKDLDAEIKRAYRSQLDARRKRVASDRFEITPPTNAALRTPFPTGSNRNFHGEVMSAVDIEPYRSKPLTDHRVT